MVKSPAVVSDSPGISPTVQVRSEPAPARVIRLRVAGIYVRGEELLLVAHQKHGRKYWLLPGGGVEYGESLTEALEREVAEECGIVTLAERLLFVNEGRAPDGSRHVMSFTFFGSVLSGEPHRHETLGPIVEVAWVPRDRLHQVTLYPNLKRQILHDWAHGFDQPTRYLGNLWED